LRNDLREFPLGPLLSLTASNPKLSKGNISIAIATKLKSYLGICPECKDAIKIFRKTKNHPIFLLILIEICDEYNNLDSRKNFQDFNFLSLSENLKLNNKSYELLSLCYFQNIHKSVRVKNVSHPILLILSFLNGCTIMISMNLEN